jgi:hypothetical protein
MLPRPLPDDQGRTVILSRNPVFPLDVKIVDVIKTNMMMTDILLEENDRMIVCGSVNVMDHENINWSDRKSTRLNSSHSTRSRMPSSA